MAETKRKHPPIPVIVLVVLLLIGGGIWWWWSATQSSQAAANQFTGSVEANQYQVASALAGRITAVKVAEGDRVTENQLLVQLDDSALKLLLDQAQQGVAVAKASLTNVKNDDDSTKADITSAEAKVKKAEAAVQLVRVQLGYTKVTAPRAGIVVSLVANTGQNASPGKTLLTISDPNDLFVRIFVPETQIGNVTIGQAAHVTTDSLSQTFDASVSYVSSVSEFTPNSVQTKDQRTKLVYEVRLKISDATGALKAGMPVDATLA